VGVLTAADSFSGVAAASLPDVVAVADATGV
jgi:hypothetical protein